MLFKSLKLLILPLLPSQLSLSDASFSQILSFGLSSLTLLILHFPYIYRVGQKVRSGFVTSYENPELTFWPTQSLELPMGDKSTSEHLELSSDHTRTVTPVT